MALRNRVRIGQVAARSAPGRTGPCRCGSPTEAAGSCGGASDDTGPSAVSHGARPSRSDADGATVRCHRGVPWRLTGALPVRPRQRRSARPSGTRRGLLSRRDSGTSPRRSRRVARLPDARAGCAGPAPVSLRCPRPTWPPRGQPSGLASYRLEAEYDADLHLDWDTRRIRVAHRHPRRATRSLGPSTASTSTPWPRRLGSLRGPARPGGRASRSAPGHRPDHPRAARAGARAGRHGQRPGRLPRPPAHDDGRPRLLLHEDRGRGAALPRHPLAQPGHPLRPAGSRRALPDADEPAVAGHAERPTDGSSGRPPGRASAATGHARQTYRARDVRDFVITASPGYRIARGTSRDGQTAIVAYTARANGRRWVDLARDELARYEKLTGVPYPYPTFRIAEIDRRPGDGGTGAHLDPGHPQRGRPSLPHLARDGAPVVVRHRRQRPVHGAPSPTRPWPTTSRARRARPSAAAAAAATGSTGRSATTRARCYFEVIYVQGAALPRAACAGTSATSRFRRAVRAYTKANRLGIGSNKPPARGLPGGDGQRRAEALPARASRACTDRGSVGGAGVHARAGQSGKTLPGLRMPCGSSAALIARMTSTARAPRWAAR